MKERMSSKSRHRRMTWVVALGLLTVGVAGGAYASSDLINEWLFGPFHADSDGTIRNADGEIVGNNQQLEDGTRKMTLDLGDVSVVAEGVDLPEGEFSLSFEPTDVAVEGDSLSKDAQE